MRRNITDLMKPIILLFISLNLTCQLNAQSTYQKDSMLIDLMSTKIKDSIPTNPNLALKMANDLIQLSEKNKYSKGLVIGYNFMGFVYLRKCNWTLAIENFNKSIALARENNFQKELSNSLYNMAGLLVEISNYEKAFEYVNDALQIKNKIGDSAGIAKCYRQLAECMFYKKDFLKANQYSEKGIAILRKFNNPRSLGNSLISFSIILMEQKKYVEALAYLLEANSIFKNKHIDDRIGDVALHLGLCYDYLGKYDSTLIYYKIGMQYAIQQEDLMHQVVLLNNTGELYFQQNNLKEAEANYLKSLSIAKEVNSLIDIRSAQKNLATLYEKKGDFHQALEYSKSFEITSDSLFSEQKTKAIEDVAVKYETKQVDEKNKFLESENTVVRLKNKQKNYYIIGALLLTIIVATFLWSYFKRKQLESTNKTNALQQKLLISQMNPHFIFNSIDNIQSLIYNHQNESAIMYLSKFSTLTRQILENATEDYILLSEEMEMLENYISVQQLLFGDHFTFEIIAENIDTESILVPPMLAQPFVENAITHGLNDKKEGGIIHIRFYWKDEQLHFEVVDNGGGLKEHSSNNYIKHKSMSTNIVRERLKQKSTTIVTKNKTDEQGNVIGLISTFEMPFIKNS